MNKVQPIEIAEWFMRKNIRGLDNSQDGNTKMQKLLFFSRKNQDYFIENTRKLSIR